MDTVTTLASLRQIGQAVETGDMARLYGKFHAHLTVTTGLDRVDELREACRRERVKLTVVELENLQGQSQTDVMTTSHYVDSRSGAVGRIVQDLLRLTGILDEAGFPVLRAKLEHESLPSITRYDQQQYHEVHIKLTVAEAAYESSMEQLRELGSRHGFVPSRNPRERSASAVSQFVNLRLYEGDRPAADAAVERVLTTLREASFEIAEVKRETALFDTHRQLDQWWI